MAMKREPTAMGCLAIYSDRAAWPSFAGTVETTVRHKGAKRAYAEQVLVGPITKHLLQTTPSTREILNCVLGVFKEWPHDVVHAVIF
jgi:hypothetical protein